ncbi:hypothetical protein [Sphingobacterium corticibacterium]|uniref:Uncharacterized protein n=1 Tax=Sphingobacterium corticibacterium TaxID=2484746 RepID=A0A4Q6XV22_9SPHI|nr:hypothetical protein [Sphingobacterium corticibacterium]RZF60236.1 hypothetical protein EWE74_14105 [Sphingobacterium corticibacterium]
MPLYPAFVNNTYIENLCFLGGVAQQIGLEPYRLLRRVDVFVQMQVQIATWELPRIDGELFPQL